MTEARGDGYITLDELKDSWKAGNETVLSMALGLGFALLTDGPNKLASSKLGRLLGLGGLVLVLAACGTGMGAQNPDNAVTPFPAVEATPTLSIHASPDQIGFPSDVDWIKPANVYDNAHVAVQADKVAMAVEAAIAQDGGGIASDCEWWEAYDDVSGSDTDWNAGLICSFNMPFQGNHYQLLALSEDNDGNPTYLGRGDGIRYYQLLDDSSRPGFVQMIEVGNPNDQLRDIFQVDKTGNIIAFLPLGETEWSIGTFGGGKVQAAPAQVSVWASIFAEPTAGAEVTVNGEAGTIEVGGQVINTPAETKPAPTVETVDPLAWYSAGPNGEIVGQEGDLCLFGATEQCFKFASPEVAVEARDGLQRVTLVMWWAESETIRAQYGTFDKFVAAIKEQPVRSDGLLMQPDEQANKDHSLVDGYNPVDPETGEPVEIDYSRYNVRVVDATTAKAEKIVFSQLGGWYSFSQSLIKVPDGKWIVGYTILDHLTLPDSSGYGGLPLNPDLDLGENALAMNQALNFLFTYMRHFENLDSYSTFSGQYPLRLGFFQVSKSAMPNAAKRTSFFVPR